jgi:hypothetical protein
VTENEWLFLAILPFKTEDAFQTLWLDNFREDRNGNNISEMNSLTDNPGRFR